MSFLSWKGNKLSTVKDVLGAMLACESKAEALRFKKRYAATFGSEKAQYDLGWLTGEMGDEDRHRCYDWFEVEHPVLGAGDPTDAEIIIAGIREGQSDGVDLRDIAEGRGHGVCDFCGNADNPPLPAEWDYPCEPFGVSLPVGHPMSEFRSVDDGWLACAPCAEAIERADLEALLRRSSRNNDEGVVAIFKGFLKHRRPVERTPYTGPAQFVGPRIIRPDAS